MKKILKSIAILPFWLLFINIASIIAALTGSLDGYILIAVEKSLDRIKEVSREKQAF